MSTRARTAIALAAVLLCAGPLEAQFWVLTDLGDIPGYPGEVVPLGISNDGRVTGTIVQESGNQAGFLWHPTSPNAVSGSISSIPTPEPGSALVQPEAVNSAGVVVGSFQTSVPYTGWRAFRWSSAQGVMTVLTSGIFEFGRAYDVNEAGISVGYRAGSAVRWQGGTYTMLPGVGALGAPLALGINNSNSATGYLAPVAGAASHVGLWTTSAAFDLGTPTGLDAARGTCINDYGQIAGDAYDTASPTGIRRIFLWTPFAAQGTSGSFADLGPINEHTLGMVNDISASGTIVGTDLSSGAPQAFVWTPSAPNGSAGSRTNLSLLIVPGSGWLTLDQAHSINDSGQIVGVGTRTGGAKRGFLLTPSAFPLPTITSVNPTSVIAGSGAFTATLSGSGFAPASTVLWNGSPRPTVYVSPTRLEAAISGDDVASTGVYAVRVLNPEPAGGLSNSVTVTVIGNPTPDIDSVSPNPLYAGGEGVDITVFGSDFVAASVVRWNGTSLPTVFRSGYELGAYVAPSLKLAAGTAAVTVSNPAPGGGVTHQLVVSILANAAPTLSSISPDVVLGGVPGMFMYGYGTGFNSNSRVRAGGVTLSTAYSNDTELVAFVPELLILQPGTLDVDVWNPSPGGGVSAKKQLVVTSSPAPIARDDEAETAKDSAVGIDLLANDIDPDFSAMTVYSITSPIAGGTLSNDGNGRYFYQPPAGFVGTDTFSYRLNDSENNLSNVAYVRVRVGMFPYFSLVYTQPQTAEPGELITVVADVVDSNGTVTSVVAGGTPLQSANGLHWTGQISASTTQGYNNITITATDNDGYKRSKVAWYVVAPVLFTRMRDCGYDLTKSTAWSHTYQVAGKVTDADPLSFGLDDGSGQSLRVEYAGHGLVAGNRAIVRGELQDRVGTLVLVVRGPGKIQKF